MVDQFASADACRVCGAPLNKVQIDGLCGDCATAGSSQASWDAQSSALAFAPYDVSPLTHSEVSPDPDRPHWGPVAGVSVWLASVAAIIVIPLIAVIAWYMIQSVRGAPLPNLAVPAEVVEWVKSPNLLLVQVLSTILAHAVTILICWAVVTQLGKRRFWASLGWNWAGRSFWYWMVLSACVIVALLVVTQLLSLVLPQSEENSFTELLRSSTRVRIAIAVLATFTAPLVEETVYRGILFSSLRRNVGLTAAVTLVTLMFAGVHVLQYLGAWVSIAGLTLLSFALTVIRARTKSILPCVAVHTLNNAFFSVLILLNKAS